MTTLSEIRAPVLEAYKARYPNQDAEITDLVTGTFGGDMCVVRLGDTSRSETEICYVAPNRTVRIFSTTEELLQFLEAKAKTSLLERMSAVPVVSAIAFLISLVAVVAAGFSGQSFDPKAMGVLVTITGLAAGAYYGTRGTRV